MWWFLKYTLDAVSTPAQVDMQTYGIVAPKFSGPRIRDNGTVEVLNNADRWR
jgi:hypothetical protein